MGASIGQGEVAASRDETLTAPSIASTVSSATLLSLCASARAGGKIDE